MGLVVRFHSDVQKTSNHKLEENMVLVIMQLESGLNFMNNRGVAEW